MTTFFSAEEVDSQLEQEFVEEVNDPMAQIEVILGNLRSNTVSRAEALSTFKRMAPICGSSGVRPTCPWPRSRHNVWTTTSWVCTT